MSVCDLHDPGNGVWTSTLTVAVAVTLVICWGGAVIPTDPQWLVCNDKNISFSNIQFLFNI